MRLISYSINIDEFQDGKHTPVMKYSGVYPSEAFKTPRDLLQSVAEFLNEEFDLHLVVKVDTESMHVSGETVTYNVEDLFPETDLDTIKDRQERIAKNKKELGF